MNFKGYERKWSWPNLRYYAGISLGRLRRTTKNLSKGILSLGRDLNPGPAEYETGMFNHSTTILSVMNVEI
jgi:hypothetical protein